MEMSTGASYRGRVLSLPPAVAFVERHVRRLEAVAIWTDQSEITWLIVSPIAINVISDNGNFASCLVHFSPSTKFAGIAARVAQPLLHERTNYPVGF